MEFTFFQEWLDNPPIRKRLKCPMHVINDADAFVIKPIDFHSEKRVHRRIHSASLYQKWLVTRHVANRPAELKLVPGKHGLIYRLRTGIPVLRIWFLPFLW